MKYVSLVKYINDETDEECKKQAEYYKKQADKNVDSFNTMKEMFLVVLGGEESFNKVVEGYEPIIENLILNKNVNVESEFLNAYLEALNIKPFIFNQYKELLRIKTTHAWNIFQYKALENGEIPKFEEIEGDLEI